MALKRRTKPVPKTKRFSSPNQFSQRFVSLGDHERFGVLRDPYERLVAQFRGSYPGYGGDWGPERLTCEVDTASPG